MLILQDLLAKKSFEQLNKKEQEFVLQQMTQEEYDMEHYIVLSSQDLFEEEEALLIVPPVNKQTLVALNKHKKPAFFIRLIQYKIPAWQAVAASLLLLFFAYQFNTKQITNPSSLASNDSTIIDTIFVDKYITQIKEVVLPADTIVKVVYKVLDNPTTPKKLKTKTQDTSPVLLAKNNASSREFEDVLQYYSSSADKPMSEDTILQLVNNNVIY